MRSKARHRRLSWKGTVLGAITLVVASLTAWGPAHAATVAVTGDAGLTIAVAGTSGADEITIEGRSNEFVITANTPLTLAGYKRCVLVKPESSPEYAYCPFLTSEEKKNCPDCSRTSAYFGLQIAGSDGNDTLTAAFGVQNVTLAGGDGNDRLVGSSYDDKLRGGAGNDVLAAVTTDSKFHVPDELDGGPGNDTASYELYDSGVSVDLTHPSGSYDTLKGIEVLAGSKFDDFLRLGSSGRAIKGNDGNDTLVGGNGANGLDGGDGRDQIAGGKGNDGIAGGDGDDAIDAGPGNDAVSGQAGFDEVTGGSGNDKLGGGANPDRIVGSGGNDSLAGGEGDDSLLGGDGTDRMFGDAGADTLIGGRGNDREEGGAGADIASYSDSGKGVHVTLDAKRNDGRPGERDYVFGDIEGIQGSIFDDVLTGNGHANVLQGSNGNDTLTGGPGKDALTGGDGSDRLSASSGNDTLAGDAGSDVLLAGNGNDGLSGDAGQDRMEGGPGHDLLDGGSDADVFDGGPGTDTATGWFSVQGGITVDLDGVPDDGGAQDVSPRPKQSPRVTASAEPGREVPLTNQTIGDNVMPSVENVQGSDFADLITGSDSANVLEGYGRDDHLLGGGGPDQLRGGRGNDVLTGGPGLDFFDCFDGDGDRVADPERDERSDGCELFGSG